MSIPFAVTAWALSGIFVLEGMRQEPPHRGRGGLPGPPGVVEAVANAIRLAEREGFVEYRAGMELKAGDKVWFNNRSFKHLPHSTI